MSSYENMCSDYCLIASKSSLPSENEYVFEVPTEFLASGRKGKLVINPIYRIVTDSPEGIHLCRRRENEKWELENLMMLKAIPYEVVLPRALIQDLHNNRYSKEMLPLLQRGVILEVPENFI